MTVDRKVYFFAIALLSLLLWVFGNYYGLGLTHDSFYYLRISAPDITLEFAPQKLYSFLLSIFDPNQKEAALAINGICLVMILAIWGRLINQSEWNPTIGLLCFGAIALGLPLITVSAFLWTESLYICMTSIGFASYFEWKKSGKLKWLFILLVSLFFSIWARKIGVIFTAVTIFALLTDLLKTEKQKHWAFLFFIFLLFSYWNVVYSGENPEAKWVWRNLVFNINALINWFVPVTFPAIFRYLFLGTMSVGLLLIKTNRHPVNQLFGYYFLIYFLIRLPIEREFFEEADRYFSILFPSFIFLLGHYSQAIFESRPSLRKVIIGILSAFILLGVTRSVKNTWMWNKNRLENQKSEITS